MLAVTHWADLDLGWTVKLKVYAAGGCKSAKSQKEASQTTKTNAFAQLNVNLLRALFSLKFALRRGSREKSNPKETCGSFAPG